MTREPTAQTLTTAGGRSELRMVRALRHPPGRVWRALTEPAELAAWFPTPVVPELRVGGRVRFDFGGDGTVTDLDPPRLLAYTWGADHLRWEVHPDGTGTRLVLVHRFDDRAGAASFAAGWHSCIAALDLGPAGRSGAPGVDMAVLHEQYVEEFGLEDGEVTPDGREARFERQFTRPAGEVRAALGGRPDPGEVFEQDVAGGRLRWEFVEGTGHGARVVLTHTATAPASPVSTDVGREQLAKLAARLR